MEEHKHFFSNVSGGCYLDGREFPCDGDYQCQCGLKFKVKTTETGHRFLPESFEPQDMSEIKEFEQQEILRNKIENAKTSPKNL